MQPELNKNISQVIEAKSLLRFAGRIKENI
jgi:hypothetical protein